MKSTLIIFNLILSNFSVFSQWQKLSNGFDRPGYTLYLDSSTNLLYVGGDFLFADSIRENNNELYLGGIFDSIGLSQAVHIAKYDGTSFSTFPFPSLAHGFSVKAIEFFQGEMYIGGNFYDTITGVNDLERWNGSSFEPFG